VELGICFDDARFKKHRQRRAALNCIIFKYCGDDDVRDLCLSHKNLLTAIVVLVRSTVADTLASLSRSLQLLRALRVGSLQSHLLREIPGFLAERIIHGPICGPTGAVAGSTATSV